MYVEPESRLKEYPGQREGDPVEKEWRRVCGGQAGEGRGGKHNRRGRSGLGRLLWGKWEALQHSEQRNEILWSTFLKALNLTEFVHCWRGVYPRARRRAWSLACKDAQTSLALKVLTGPLEQLGACICIFKIYCPRPGTTSPPLCVYFVISHPHASCPGPEQEALSQMSQGVQVPSAALSTLRGLWQDMNPRFSWLLQLFTQFSAEAYLWGLMR